MVRVSPAARKSKLLSAALNLATIDPAEPVLLSVLTEVVSADASTVPSPLGSVAPPDQVIEARFTLTVLTLKLVKVSEAEGAMSSLVLPMVLARSEITCAPETSAASSGLGGVTRGGVLDTVKSMTPWVVGVALMVTVSGAGGLF